MKKKEINLNETIEKLRRTELLLEISRKIAGLKTLEKILWTLIEFVTDELNADRGTLFLNDQDTNELYSRIAQGELTREIRILNNVGIAGAIFQKKKVKSFMMFTVTQGLIKRLIKKLVTKPKIWSVVR